MLLLLIMQRMGSLLDRMFFVHGYVMLCNSVCTSVTSYLVSLYFVCVYVHGDLVPDVIALCFVLG